MRRLILSLSILIATPAQAEWWEARTDHFIIYSKSGAADAKQFAENLERYDQSLRSLQVIKPDPRLSDARKVKIFRAGTIVDISVLAGDAESGVAGFYIPRLEPVAFVPAREPIQSRKLLDAETVLKHEYTHHFMFRHFAAAYPSWYVEGFAEALSTIRFEKDGSFHVGDVPQARGDALVGSSKLNYSVKRMLLSGNKPTFEDVYGRYTYGWLFTHYMTFEPSRRGQLQTYLRLINDGVDAAEAAKRAFGDIDRLEGEISRYKNGGRFLGADIKPGNYQPPVVAMRKLGPDEEAILPLVTLTKRGVGSKEATSVAGNARAVAANYPTSYPVQLELAEAELDAKNLAAADRAADAAIALRPQSADALYLKGNIALEKAKSDPGQYAAARQWFAKAYDADPDDPRPLVGNYLTYSKAGASAPESAIIGLEQAYRLAPYDGNLRITLARQLLTERKLDVAKMLLVPLALSPHESKQAKALNEVVELIDAANGGGALTKLDAWVKTTEKEKNNGD